MTRFESDDSTKSDNEVIWGQTAVYAAEISVPIRLRLRLNGGIGPNGSVIHSMYT